MMQIIHCNECGGSDIALDSISVTVNLEKHSHCDKCYHGHTETQTYFFCSLACFRAYISKVAQEKAEFRFKTYDQMFGQNVPELDPKV